MEKDFSYIISVLIVTALYVYILHPFVSVSQAKGVKTSYKQYSIYKYNEAYEQSSPGKIDIPVIEFSARKKIAEARRKIDAHELAQLKKYSALIGGTLLSQGKMYFPGKNGPGKIMDLSSNHINLEAEFGRVVRHDDADLLINFGNVYGLYAAKKSDKIFVSIEPVSQDSKKYLEKENIKIITTGGNSQAQ